jgi:hypothetical protein
VAPGRAAWLRPGRRDPGLFSHFAKTVRSIFLEKRCALAERQKLDSNIDRFFDHKEFI